MGNGKFTGVSSGSRTLIIGWSPANGTSATRPFLVLNPNATDDARGHQTVSTVVVYEVIA